MLHGSRLYNVRDASTRERVNASTRRPVDAPTRRRVDASTLRRVDPRRRVDASTLRRVDGSTHGRLLSFAFNKNKFCVDHTWTTFELSKIGKHTTPPVVLARHAGADDNVSTAV